MKLIELALTMAYDAKVNYNDVFYQVRMWDTIIYNYLKKKGIVIPPKVTSNKDEKYAGAYVKEPIPGVYDWVVSFDLNSLYPHLIMQYNISPETLLDERHPTATVDKILGEQISFEMYKDYAVCANGAMFRKDKKGFLPELWRKCMVSVSSSRRECSKQSRSTRRLLLMHLKKRSPDVTTFKWRRRFLLTLLMVLLVINTSGITN